jgi:hypothetical protein
MPKIQPTDEPRPGGPQQPIPQPQPTADSPTASVERVIEVEEREEPATPE